MFPVAVYYQIACSLSQGLTVDSSLCVLSMWLDPVTKLGQFVLNSYINEQNKMPLIPT